VVECAENTDQGAKFAYFWPQCLPTLELLLSAIVHDWNTITKEHESQSRFEHCHITRIVQEPIYILVVKEKAEYGWVLVQLVIRVPLIREPCHRLVQGKHIPHRVVHWVV